MLALEVLGNRARRYHHAAAVFYPDREKVSVCMYLIKHDTYLYDYNTYLFIHLNKTRDLITYILLCNKNTGRG